MFIYFCKLSMNKLFLFIVFDKEFNVIMRESCEESLIGVVFFELKIDLGCCFLRICSVLVWVD